MINKTSYDIVTVDGKIHVTITPVIERLPGRNFYQTGIYILNNGVAGMGTITFSDEMKTWKYEGLDAFTYKEAAEIAEFIKEYKDPEGAHPSLLQ